MGVAVLQQGFANGTVLANNIAVALVILTHGGCPRGRRFLFFALVLPEVFESIGRQRGVTHGRVNRLVSRVMLDRPRRRNRRIYSKLIPGARKADKLHVVHQGVIHASTAYREQRAGAYGHEGRLANESDTPPDSLHVLPGDDAVGVGNTLAFFLGGGGRGIFLAGGVFMAVFGVYLL